MKPCETIREDLKAYLDGELPFARRGVLRLHLLRCAACREEKHAMEQLGNEIRAGETGGLDTALRAKLIAGIPGDLPEAPAEASTPRFRLPQLRLRPEWKRRPMLLWGAAALACLALFTFQVSNNLNRGIEAEGSTASASGEAMPLARAPAAGMEMAKQQMEVARNEAVPAETASKKPMYMPGGAFGEGRSSAAASAPANPAAKSTPMFPPTGLVQDRTTLHATSGRAVVADAGGKEANESKSEAVFKVTQNGKSVTRQVHKEADITLEVDKIEEKSDTIEQMVKTMGGYVASNQLTTGEDNLKSASLTTKIPVNLFEEYLSKLTKLGNVKAKSVTGEDLTEQMSDERQAKRALSDEIADAEARLKEARGRVQRREEADNLRDLRIQAAQAQGRLELLQKMATLSTVTIQLQEKPKPIQVEPNGGFMSDIQDTFRSAGQSFLQAARLPVLLLVWAIAYSPLWIALLLAYRYAVRR